MPLRSDYDAPWLDLQALAARRGHLAVDLGPCPDADSLAAGYALYCFFKEQGLAVSLRHSGEALRSPGLLEMIRLLSIPLAADEEGRVALRILVGPGGCEALARRGLNARGRGSEGSGEEGSGKEIGNAGGNKAGEDRLALISHYPVAGVPPSLHDLRPYLSSTSSIVWQELVAAGRPPSGALAACLLYGLYVASNGFTEIRFPLDRDMIDALGTDSPLFASLCRKRFAPSDLALAAEALHGLECGMAEGVALLNLLPCEPGVLRFIGDFALGVQGLDLALAYTESDRGLRFVVRSGVREYHAGELAARLTANGLGGGGGGREKGGGFITAGAWAALHGGYAPFTFFQDMIRAYKDAYDLVDLGSGSGEAVLRRGVLKAYQKRPVIQGYVRCSRLFPGERRLRVRMMEGDIIIRGGPGVYLMIGLAGEVYPISKEVFRRRYLPAEEPFGPRCLYEPTVTDLEGNRCVPLLPLAESCRSRERRVLARPLERGIKLFTAWDAERCLKGEPGDWLVQSRDDAGDWYVVTGEMFSLLYEQVRPKAKE